MAISKTDIKLMQSKRLTDDDNGGGVITGTEIPDGVVNNLFPDISRLDKTLGRVSLRKAFMTVSTDNVDQYYGSHVIISEPQNDSDINLLLMETKNDFDERLEAQELIQAPIDITDSTESVWEVFGAIVLQTNYATFGPKTAGAYVPSTFPWGSTPSEIQIDGNTYDGSIDYPENRSFTKMELTLSTPLLANVAIDTPVYNSQAETRWKTEVAALAGESIVFLKHDTFYPDVGDNVVLYDHLLRVDSIDSTDWTRPVYTFSENINSTESGSGILKRLNDTQNISNNNYYGVTTLSADVLASASEITVSETDKYIYPIGSEGVDQSLIGLDTNSLPPSKRVQIINNSYVIVIHSTTTEDLPDPVTLGNTYSLTGTDYQLIELVDVNDVQLNPLLYTVDLVVGSVTIESGIDLSPYTQPFTAQKRYEDMRLVTGVNHTTKVVTLGRPLSQNFTAANTFVSSALIFGDVVSSYENLFDQETWTDVWQDTLIGNNASGTYNDTGNPVQLTNAGTVTENWALVFTSDTTFDIIGQHLGVIGTGQTNAAPGTFTQPINPETLLPYFQLAQEGWGAGWSIGNVLRFKTTGCNKPLWFIRVTQQGDDMVDLTDKFTIQIRGDAN